MHAKHPLDGEGGASLDPCEFELIRQAMAEALGSGEDCEIEQMVRLRTVLPVRRRVQVRLERDANDKIAAVPTGANDKPVEDVVLESVVVHD